jgi:Ca-activated chloride channel homolog
VRGTSLTYVSAVAVEEKSVIDYNKGNPDGVVSPGEEPREPRVPLVAIYPTEGTLYSDNPFIVLDAPWVDDAEREGARRFEEFIQRPEAQERVLEFGFRPGNVDVPIDDPISAQWGVDPDQPQTLLEVPEPSVLTGLLDRWDQDRKRARVMLLVDASGSMGDPADPDGQPTPTKLDLAKTAVVEALDEFATDDDVGLRIFTTDLGPAQDEDWLDLVPIGPLVGQRESTVRSVNGLFPQNGTPLYTATSDTYDDMIDAFDPERINAVVLLSDGRNEDPDNIDLEALIQHLREGSEGERAQPVRVFAIAYGGDADLETLRRIAEATNAQVYDASDATSIDRVFTAVVSNF